MALGFAALARGEDLGAVISSLVDRISGKEEAA
jgi:hypothetical protein